MTDQGEGGWMKARFGIDEKRNYLKHHKIFFHNSSFKKALRL